MTTESDANTFASIENIKIGKFSIKELVENRTALEDDIDLWDTRQLGATAEFAEVVEMPSGLQLQLKKERELKEFNHNLDLAGITDNDTREVLIAKQFELKSRIDIQKIRDNLDIYIKNMTPDSAYISKVDK